jgi:predicted dehydrogenase/threonine dehydrogenase-like Zn-dependent dehydrogenase
MRQVLQNQKTGQTELVDVPSPRVRNGHVLIRTRRTLISPGTEKAVLDFGKASLIEKARKNPEKVKMVLDRLRKEGFLETFEAVTRKLEQRIALGYCNSGIVLEVGKGVKHLKRGERVASNGKHAEVVNVPANLCVKTAGEVSDDHAAFTVLGAIGIQGIRLAQPSLGETFVVIGLGLVGLITVQLLAANGCRVLGIDFDSYRLALARQFGAYPVDLSEVSDPVSEALSFSGERGVDGVIITASTSGSEPVHQAAQMCRKRGRIVLVGVTGLELSRDDFYEKELTFQVSCSYGPGRYDPVYEEQGHDYPFGFVRWTEQRNMEAMMELLARGKIDVESLISHRFPLQDVGNAYEVLGGQSPCLGIILEYPDEQNQSDQSILGTNIELDQRRIAIGETVGVPVVGFLGAGDHASRILIPAFLKTNCVLKSIAANTGTTCVQIGKRYGFQQATTDTDSVIADPDVSVVVIATRHDSHARLVIAALKAGKHVFVEKPLALNEQGLAEIVSFYESHSSMGPIPILTVGFNRRFAPHIMKIRELLGGINHPKCFVMTVNAGFIPADHWIQDPVIGGGRIVGEACHFVDLLRFLAQSPIISVQAASMEEVSGKAPINDNVTFSLGFADGSLGTVHYFSNGYKDFPKERLEVFCGGKILQMDNFERLRGWGWSHFTKMNLWRQDKGHNACVSAFVRAVKSGGPFPIAFSELVEVSEITLRINNLIMKGCDSSSPAQGDKRSVRTLVTEEYH